jgi:hypothetical protein
MTLTGMEIRDTIEALRFRADALTRQAKGRKEAGGGVVGRDHRNALRDRAKRLRGLASRLGYEREQQARAAEVTAGAERARLRVERGEHPRLITYHNRDND